MSQNHLDRLKAMDASFLLQEGPTSHAHVGGVAVLHGPPPRVSEVRDQVTARLDLMPRYRHRLVNTVLDRARPVWADDVNFDVAYHVRDVGLPAPGGREQFEATVGTLYSQPLDRSRPLWEIWQLEGFDDGGFALLFKAHHAMIDGSGAIDLLKILFDLSPDAPPTTPAARRWQPQPTPRARDLLTFGARDAANAARRVAVGAIEAARDPGESLKTGLEVAEGAGSLVRELVKPPPNTPLTTRIGRHRRFVGVRCALQDAKRVKNAFGATVNDVVLAVVTGALRTFLVHRGVRTDGLALSALVPVSLRSERDDGRLGNRIAVLRGTLPVSIDDSIERLETVIANMAALKCSKQARATELVFTAQDFLPPVLLPLVTRINVSPRLFNVMVTNVPGPQMPLYVLGRELRELYPTALLQPNHALAVAVTSYNGQLNFGILGDYSAVADIHVVADAIVTELSTLVELAGAKRGAEATAPPEPAVMPASEPAAVR